MFFTNKIKCYLILGQIFKKTSHEWNTIEINNEWYFIECTWGSGKLDSKKKFNFSFNPYYFLCPAQFFIEDHFPLQTDFLLLKEKFTKTQFENSYSYNLSRSFQALYDTYENLKLIEPNFFVINYDESKNSFDNKDKIPSIKLYYSGKDVIAVLERVNSDSDNTTKIPDKTFIKQLGNDSYEIFYKIPENGNYQLNIFQKEKSESEKYQSFLKYHIHAINVEKNYFLFATSYDFKDFCQLIQPLKKKLKIGEEILFKIKLSDYANVAILQEDYWGYLSVVMDKDLWEGNVEIKSKEIYIMGQKTKKDNYKAIFEYEGFK